MKLSVLVSAFFSILAVLGLLYAGYLFVFVLPKFEQIFRDLNSKLPPITVICIKAANLGLGYFMAVIALAMIAKDFVIESDNQKMIVSIIGFIVSMLICGTVQFAVFQALVQIIE